MNTKATAFQSVICAVFAALPAAARAERVAASAGEYVSDSRAPDASGGPLMCPGTAQVVGTTLTFSLQAFAEHALHYGTIKVPLDASGGFHDKVPLPPRGAWEPESNPAQGGVDPDDLLFRDAKEVVVDAYTAEIGGAPGHALVLKVALPPKEEGKRSRFVCVTTLLDIQPPKLVKSGHLDGEYWSSTGGSQGQGLHCPSHLVVSGDKVSFTVPSRFASWAVMGLPLAKDGSFSRDVSFAKIPPDEVLRSVDYYRDAINALHGFGPFHVKGSFENVDIIHKNQHTQNLTLEVESEDASCRVSFYKKGTDLGGGVVNCKAMSAAQRKMHPVCQQ